MFCFSEVERQGRRKKKKKKCGVFREARELVRGIYACEVITVKKKTLQRLFILTVVNYVRRVYLIALFNACEVNREMKKSKEDLMT